MKGLALEVVWGLIIAMVGVLVFLLLVTGTFKNAANWFYCDIYIKIINFFSGSELASIPDQCEGITPVLKKEEVKDVDNKIFSRKLLAYVIACWKEVNLKGLYESHPCYELRLSGNVENVSEENVTSILIKEDHCRSIENSDFNDILDYDCGEKNQILWSVDGEIEPLSRNNISDIINEFTEPDQMPVDENMIPSTDKIKTKVQLNNFLTEDVPESICNSLGSRCNSWKYVKSLDYVWIKVTDNGESRVYAYFIGKIISSLESKGLVESSINTQKIILIEYNGAEDAVEVIG